MPTLAELSAERLSPEMVEFAGSTMAEKLISGRAASRDALLKYTELSYDEGDAREAMADVDAWAERQRQELADVLKSGAESLPDTLVLEMGRQRAQDFIVASFTLAAVGVGPYAAGEVARLSSGGGTVVDGTLLNSSWAIDDAEMRLQTFATIVALERRGQLEQIFAPQGQAGLGIAASTVAVIAIVAAIVAAAVVLFVVYDRQLERNNEVLAELCREAQRRGDDDVVQACIEASRDLQLSPLAGFGKELAKWIAIFGGAYLLTDRVILPWLERRSEK